MMNRKELFEALKRITAALPSRPPVPVLTGVLLERRDGWLHLSAFDYELSCHTTVKSPSDADFPPVLVSGRLLADLVGKVKADEVGFDVTNGKPTLTVGRAQYELVTLPVDDYPRLPVVPPAKVTFTADQVKQWRNVTVACARGVTVPTLDKVRFEFTPESGTVTLAATDRYRLHVLEQSVSFTDGRGGESTSVLVPQSTVDLIARLSTGHSVAVGWMRTDDGDGMLSFTFGDNTEFTARLVDGEFPKYRALLFTREDTDTVVDVDKAGFVDAVKAASLVAERNTPVRLDFTDGLVTVRAGAGDETQGKATVDATVTWGRNPRVTGFEPADHIAFDPSFLLDALNATPGGVVSVTVRATTRPALITPVDAVAQRLLLMPVRMS